jgi:hypothetical protein
VPRIAAASGLAAALVVIVAVAALAGSGDDRQLGNGDLVWVKQARLYRNPNLPDDRVVRGVIRNNSLKIVTLSARDLHVRTAAGDRLDTAAVFAPTFIRGVFPENRGQDIPESEQLRIGLRARIEPGKTVPVTVAWREPDGRASAIDYGGGSLPVPEHRPTGARRG